MLFFGVCILIIVLVVVRFWIIWPSFKDQREREIPSHPGNVPTLVVWGSGGHTAEMKTLLQSLDLTIYQPRVHIIARTDTKSGHKVVDVEKSNAFSALGLSALATFLLGVVFMLIGWGKLERISRREGISIVGLGWVSSAIVSALPYYLVHPLEGCAEPMLGFSGAIFEATSGITATAF